MIKKSNEITVSNDLLPAMYSGQDIITVDDIIRQQEERKSESFLPYVFFTNDKNCSKGVPLRELFISLGQEKRPVEVPFLISYIATRPTLRKMVGDKYGKRVYQAYPGKPSKSAKEFEEMFAILEAKGDKDSLGYTHIFFLIEGQGSAEKIHIVTAEGFRSETGYLARPLNQAWASKGKGAIITIKSHEPNTRTSASGRKYLDGAKFDQFTVRDLTLTEREGMKVCFEEKRKQIDNFMSA